MSERIGIHLSTNEWVETDVLFHWEDFSRRVANSYESGEGLIVGDEVFNPFRIVSVRRGGVPVDPEQTV
jgi:hypothetical protein